MRVSRISHRLKTPTIRLARITAGSMSGVTTARIVASRQSCDPTGRWWAPSKRGMIGRQAVNRNPQLGSAGLRMIEWVLYGSDCACQGRPPEDRAL